MEALLKIEKLTKNYRDKKANDQISFEVNKGDIVGIIGENGAGKTTLLKMICGHIKPSSGCLIYRENITIGGLIESPGILPYLSADENLKAKQLLIGKNNKEEREHLLKVVGLNSGKKQAKDFSLGMKQRLGIALAVVGNTDLLILDEPINGLDPTGIIEIRGFLKDINQKEGKTIIISSHLLEELSKVATKYIFIKDGKVVYQCDRKELATDTDLEDLYVKYVGGEKVE